MENTSGFNTSLVTSVQINQDEIRPPFQIPPQPKEEKPPAKEEDDEKLEDEHIIPVKPQSPPKGRCGRSVPEGKTVEKLGAKEPLWTWRRSLFPEKIPADSSGSGPEAIYEEDSSGDSSEEEGRDNVIAWNLLGIFQLSDHVACDPGSSGSLNLCGLECSGEWRTNTPWYIQAIFYVFMPLFYLESSRWWWHHWWHRLLGDFGGKQQQVVSSLMHSQVFKCTYDHLQIRLKYLISSSGLSPKKRFLAKMWVWTQWLFLWLTSSSEL